MRTHETSLLRLVLRCLTVGCLSIGCLTIGCGTQAPGCEDGLALEGVTVIDGLGNQPLPDQTVLVCSGRIRAIEPRSTIELPRGVNTAEMKGRFVIPGLIDMHAHVTILPTNEDGRMASAMHEGDSHQTLRTLLAFGITTVRNPAAPTQDGVALRNSVASGEHLGPRIFTAGSAISGNSPPYGPFVAARTPEDVRREVQAQAEAGVDFIKVYASLGSELVEVAIDEAHQHELPVIGHLQRTSWTKAARLGIDQITHGAPWSAEYLPAAVRDNYRGGMKDRITWLEQVDLEALEIAEMIEALVEQSVSIDPTLLVYRTKFFGDDPRHIEHPELALAPASARVAWERGSFTKDWTTGDFARAKAAWPKVLELTARLHTAGVQLTAGSDLPNPWVIPGVSFHEELQLLSETGIPALEVLKIATFNGAKSLGIADSVGSVEVGKQADLLVLAADPLRRMANTRAIELVLLEGQPLSPSALLNN